MNKKSTRAFAFGILISVCIIGVFYFSEEKKVTEGSIIDEETAKSYLQNNDYVILTKDQYNQMNKSISEAQENTKKIETQLKDEQKTADKEKSSNRFNLEIISGMVSHDIAIKLEEKMIIDNADQFEVYLEENGYSKRIQLGSFELMEGMSYKEIAKIITKS